MNRPPCAGSTSTNDQEMTMLRVFLRLEMRAAGYGFFEINRAMSHYSRDKVNRAAEMVKAAGYSVPTELVGEDGDTSVGAIGDGEILRKLWEWLQSEQGRMFIQFLLSLLMLV